MKNLIFQEKKILISIFNRIVVLLSHVGMKEKEEKLLLDIWTKNIFEQCYFFCEMLLERSRA